MAALFPLSLRQINVSDAFLLYYLILLKLQVPESVGVHLAQLEPLHCQQLKLRQLLAGQKLSHIRVRPQLNKQSIKRGLYCHL
jgi:hypothetical protein